MHSTKSGGRRYFRIRKHSGLSCALAAIIVAVGTTQVRAQCVEEQKLTASDARPSDIFGVSVSVSGDTAVVGARPSDDCVVIPDCQGVAYVFRFNGTSWVEVQKLVPSDGGGGFGVSVSVSEDTILVGAWVDACAAGTFCGAAYVFRFDGIAWVEEQKLTASDAAQSATFGHSVSLSGDTALVGAPYDDCAGGHPCGSSYVFRFNGTSWVQVQKLTASDAGSQDEFGSAVSISGSTVVIGASGDDCAAGNSCGSAYVFRFEGADWVEEQKLTASDVGGRDRFGDSVSVSEDTILVGAWVDACAAGTFCGAAYVFRFDGHGWVEEQKLAASDARPGDFFGFSVSLSEDTAVVGARGTSCAAGDTCGSAYVFRYDGAEWLEEQQLTASDAAAHASFGVAVSVSADTVVVGAGGDECAGQHSACGAAYMFSCASEARFASLDIKPGSCPNPVNQRSNGVVPVAIIGSSDFDVATIDLDSLTLARVDGLGESVTPLASRRGLRVIIEDVATPSGGEPCECQEAVADGLDDLSLKFSTSEMSRAFELTDLSKGETIELVLRGTLQDGTPFEATDCIVVPGTRRTSSGLRRGRGSK